MPGPSPIATNPTLRDSYTQRDWVAYKDVQPLGYLFDGSIRQLGKFDRAIVQIRAQTLFLSPRLLPYLTVSLALRSSVPVLGVVSLLLSILWLHR